MNTTDTNIAAGELRSRIWIQTPTRTTENTLGERSITFADDRKVWAQVSPLAGRELERGRAVSASVSHVVILRYDKDLKPDHRFRFGTSILSIDALIDVNSRHIKHVAYCTEVVSVA